MTNGHHRRRFLQLAGTGAAASIAGCTDMGLLSSNDNDERITVVAEPSQADFEELNEQIESGEMDQMEAQQRAQELQEDAIDAFESYAEDEDIEIEESTDEAPGLYLVDGSDEAILGALRNDLAGRLYGGDTYEQILEQQERQQQQQEIDEEELEEQLEEEGEGNESGDNESGDGGDADDATDEESDGEGDANETDDE